MKRSRNRETFAESIFSLMMSQVVVKILGLFYKLYLTNRDGFGDEGNAIANGGFQIFALILSIVGIGIPTAISKLISETMAKGNYKGAYKIFKVALIIFSTIGILGSFLLLKHADFFANNYLHMKETQLSIIALSPSIFLVSIISVLKGFFSGRKSIKGTARAQSLEQLVKTIITVVMIELSIIILKNTNTELMAALSNLATTLGNLAEFMYLYKMYKKELPIIKQEIQNSSNKESLRIKDIVKNILLVAIPMSLTALISTISKNIDSSTIVKDLTNLIGYEEAKMQYGILSGKVDALINFPLSFNIAIVTALLPAIASTGGNLKLQERRINKSLMLAMTISFPITFFFCGFSDEILQFLFPNASSGGDILKISSIAIIFITIEQITNIILNGLGKNFIPVKAITVGVIFKAILNRMLVHRIDLAFGGTMGAAIATLICHLVTATISTVMVLKHSKIHIELKSFTKPLGTGLIMICISRLTFILLQNKIDFRINFIISTAIAVGIVALMNFKKAHYCKHMQ